MVPLCGEGLIDQANLNVSCYDIARIIFQLGANVNNTWLLTFLIEQYHIVRDARFEHDWAS